MIRPPFTLMILKRTRHPVTIRITTARFLALLFLLLGPWVTAVYLSFHPFGGRTAVVLPFAPVAPSDQTTFAPEQPAAASGPDTAPSAEVRAKTGDAGEMVLTCTFTGLPPGEPVYLWLIVNSDAGGTGEMVVYPRNPLFRGLPVDYRNGVIYDPGKGEPASFEVAETAGIRIEQFRLLVYGREGALLIDRTFGRTDATLIRTDAFWTMAHAAEPSIDPKEVSPSCA